MKGRKTAVLVSLLMVAALVITISPVSAQMQGGSGTKNQGEMKRVTQAEREAAAARSEAVGLTPGTARKGTAVPTPGGTPDYFGPYPNYANSPLPSVNITSFIPVFYFAEGTCRPDFDPYITIQNPGSSDADVKITYMTGDGTNKLQYIRVPASSRGTVHPPDVLGTGEDAAHDFSAKVECTNSQQIVVERPMYFNYHRVWTGGHDAVGATTPASTFYFAEGTTRPDFDPYICIQNPEGTDADVTITYMKGDGNTVTEALRVARNSRSTVAPRLKLGTGEDAAHDFSAKVECTSGQKIIAERPMYFNYHGVWTGGHDAVGVTTPASTFYFAEGTTRPDFDPYICIQNPGSNDADVTVTYMKVDGTITTDKLTVAKNSRSTVSPRAKLGTGDDAAHDFSAKVECTNGQNIIAERPMYFNYHGVWTGGHDAVGALAPASTFYFAEGTCRPDFEPYITIQNPGLVDADVVITYMKGDSTTKSQDIRIQANSRGTIHPADVLGTGDDAAHDFSAKVECTNGQKIIAERPMYFNYRGVWTGGSDAVGFTFSPSTTDVVPNTGIRKFVDSLPGLGAANANDLGQYIPVAVPDTGRYPGCDYYEIELGQYAEQLHKDLPPTVLRGYRQTNTSDPTVSSFSYLGPMVVAQRNRPVRVKFTNKLPTGTGGNLFIPVDTSIMGAGAGPNGGDEKYTQNRAAVHLHGGNTPWISDGTMHQWTTPAGESTSYPNGVSVKNVPDMDGGVEPQGTLTFYYTNQQSARLMFYHDHSYGTTRLNVYAGEAAGYILQDPAEKGLVDSGIIPSDQVPLIIQDKTFVPDDAQLAAEDPTWDKARYGGKGNLWLPHVYMPNQNPYDISGASAMGRWDYGPWFWPPFTGLVHGAVDNPYYDPVNAPWEPPKIPGTPNPSIVPEAFMDTPLVNGTAYPYVKVGPKAYRLRILNACNDRNLNLQLYFAKSNGEMWDPTTGVLRDGDTGEVNMVPATPNTGLPATWPTDGRDGGVPDPNAAGPNMVQIGNEGGFMPQAAELPNTPIGYEYNRRNIVVLNVTNKTLFLGPAERADVIVDFSKVPEDSRLILYNDSPAPVPAFDTRYDYYTGDPDQTSTGGAPTTLPGYGPNTRTIMQFQVSSSVKTGMSGFSLDALKAALPAAYAQYQPKPIVPQAEYNAAFNANYPADAYARIQDTTMSFTGPLTALTLTAGGGSYTSAPSVSFSGGGGSGAAATAQISGVTSVRVDTGGSGYNTSAPVVSFTSATGSGATAVASVTSGVVTGITVTNSGSGYATAPTVNLVGGGGTSATATAFRQLNAVTGLTLTNQGSGYSSNPTVSFSGGGGGAGAAATATAMTMAMQPKAIQELFEPNYGRMNAILGVEIPNTTGINQTTIPYSMIDPPTEIVNTSDALTSIGTLGDGTQIWKITHNGVDTHAIHWHMFNVQLINRVGWDGAVTPPDPNELGWKETVRMNPLEDAIVALRPIIPTDLPFDLLNSHRRMAPADAEHNSTGFSNIDPLNQPAPVTNEVINLGWEYVWHCHLLGHEENDMMRPMGIAVAPAAPTIVSALNTPTPVTLTWTDNSKNETNWTIQRMDAGTGWTTVGTKTTSDEVGTGGTETYNDTTFLPSTEYTYRVLASNVIGYTKTYTLPVIGYPHPSTDSPPSGTRGVTTGP
jgi:FtsP/CotA-like multicopper oxidase with cupredoxin domain